MKICLFYVVFALDLFYWIGYITESFFEVIYQILKRKILICDSYTKSWFRHKWALKVARGHFQWHYLCILFFFFHQWDWSVERGWCKVMEWTLVCGWKNLLLIIAQTLNLLLLELIDSWNSHQSLRKWWHLASNQCFTLCFHLKFLLL